MRAFLTAARIFIPKLTFECVGAAPAGVRAQAVDADGSLVDDFRIAHLRHVLLARSAPSSRSNLVACDSRACGRTAVSVWWLHALSDCMACTVKRLANCIRILVTRIIRLHDLHCQKYVQQVDLGNARRYGDL